MESTCMALNFSALSQAQIAREAQTSVMKTAMDSQGALAGELLASMEAAMTKVMEMSFNPHLGSLIDLIA